MEQRSEEALCEAAGGGGGGADSSLEGLLGSTEMSTWDARGVVVLGLSVCHLQHLAFCYFVRVKLL